MNRETGTPSATALDDALREADRCVKCGLCLPSCPTYRLSNDENRSPRGRIALAEGLLRGQLPPDAKLLDHLYSCLLCRRCERVCPSGVRYAELMDSARATVPQQHWLARLSSHPARSERLSRLAHKLPLPGRLGRLARALPPSVAPKPGRYPARGEPRGRVGLFLGCVTRAQQGAALTAALDILNGLGYAVVIPSAQGCCGALAQHAGDSATAQAQIEANQQAFAQVDTLLVTASGCAAQLQENHPAQVLDMVTFLRRVLADAPLALPPLAEDAALHLPCSATNVLRNGDDSAALLGLIPQLRLHPLGQAGDCCGAAGDHLLTRPEQAARLRHPLLQELLTLRPRYLLTSNIGCALHLAEGMGQAGVDMEVLHPVQLLARQLRAASE